MVDGVGENAPRYILKDSKRIIHALMSHEGKSVPETEIQRKETELAWVKWSDDVLVQLIVMNIYRTIQVGCCACLKRLSLLLSRSLLKLSHTC